VAKKILIALVVLVGILVAVIATRPATYRVERAAEINAAPAIVFEQVNDFHRWEGWSPWAKLDPNIKLDYAGPAAGEGAIYKWVGNDDVGEGSMTILESKPAERVRIKLEFIKPFAQTSITSFDFKGDAAKSRVTWLMEGQNNFLGKAMSMFMDLDQMIGKDFEKGLGQLKAVSEAEAARVAAAEAQAAQAAQQAQQEQPAPAAATKDAKEAAH
jgi:hypothetical protein